MGRGGFVGKVDSSLEEAVGREEDVGSAFPQWGSGGGAGAAHPQSMWRRKASPSGRRRRGGRVLSSGWVTGTLSFLEWDPQWTRRLFARGEVLHSEA